MSVPYIGSRISLISKSEIRYEGILFHVDPKESTVALQNVRSFGTEGRKKDGAQIPASQDVFDYIIFRGSDIKDLHVCEPPPPPPVARPPNGPNDPAIIAMPNSGGAYGGYGGYGGGPPGFGYWTAPYFGPPMGGPMMPNQFPPQGAPPHPLSSPVNQTAPNGAPAVQTPGQHPPQPQHQQPQQQPGQAQTAPQPAAAAPPTTPAHTPIVQGPQVPPQPQAHPPQQPSPPQQEQHPSEKQPLSTQPSNERQHANPGNPQQPRHNNQGRNNNNNRRYNNNNNNGGGNYHRTDRVNNGQQQHYPAQNAQSQPPQHRPPHDGRRRGPPGPRPQQPPSRPLEEFDLVSSNARFDKEKVMEELSHADKPNALPAQPLESVPDAGPDDTKIGAYNKTASFFDNISCESLERGSDKDRSAGPRQTYAEQRKLDAETFGLPPRDTRPSYHRHHYRRPPVRGGPPPNKVFRPVQNSNKPPAASPASPAENGVSGPKKQ